MGTRLAEHSPVPGAGRHLPAVGCELETVTVETLDPAPEVMHACGHAGLLVFSGVGEEQLLGGHVNVSIHSSLERKFFFNRKSWRGAGGCCLQSLS